MNYFTLKNKSHLKSIVVAFLLLPSLNSFAIDKYVKAGATGNLSGSSWDNAMSSLAAAVTAANTASPALNNV